MYFRYSTIYTDKVLGIKHTKFQNISNLTLNQFGRMAHIYSCFSPYLHLRISALPPLSSTRLRQKLISPDICFQSKASSLLFPLCRLSIKRINLCAGKDHKRISLCLFSVSDSALSFFLTGCMCSSCLAIFWLYTQLFRKLSVSAD